MLSCLLNLEESPIRKNKLLFAESNINLEFSDDFYDAVVDKAIKAGTGARALNSIVKTSISTAAFELLGQNHLQTKKIIVTKNCIEEPSKYETI